MSNKLTTSTTPGYATAWRNWLDFCARVGFHPVCGPALRDTCLRRLAEFLTSEHERDQSGGSVQNARALLCGVYKLFLGERKLSKHPWLASVVRAAKIAQPPKP